MSMRQYRVVVATAAVLIFSPDIAVYPVYGLRPVIWIAIFFAISTPLLAVAALQGRLRLEPILLWSLGYFAISFLWYFPSSQSAAAWYIVRIRILSALFLLLMFFLFLDARAQRAARRAVVVATLLSSALSIYELFNPMTFGNIPGRSSGLFGNPTQLGAAIVLGLVLGQGVVPPRFRSLYVIATGFGVLPTFSRAAILGWVLVCLATWLLGRARLAGLLRFGAVSAAALLFLLTPWWAGLQSDLDRRGVLNENVLDRLTFFESGAADDASAEVRGSVARLAWETFADHPLSGTGTGATTENLFEVVGPHNIYLSMLAEHGISGLVIFPGLLLAAIWGADRETALVVIPFALFIVFWGLFSHNVLDERYILLSFAMVAAIVSTRRQQAAHVPQAPG